VYVARNSSSSYSKPTVACNHRDTDSKFCKVRFLNQDDVNSFHAKLFKNKSKIDQDNFLLHYMQNADPKRRRPRSSEPKRRTITEYFIRKINGQVVRVCAQTFCSVTGISRYRLNGIANSFNKTGKSRGERSGGSQKKKVILR